MLLGLVQVLLLCSFAAFAAIPVVFLVLLRRYMLGRWQGRGVVIAGLFIAGALAAGFSAWQSVPSVWTLPFWTTLKATVDTGTYGHDVEHYAEGIIVLMTFAAMAGGSVCAGAAALGPGLLKKLSSGSRPFQSAS